MTAARVPLVASGLLLSHLLVALVIIPPWQNPDEPQHVMFASALAKHGVGMLPNAFDDQVEGEIIQSMARHRWWQLYGRETPSPLPPSFKGVQSVEMASVQGPASYYIAAAWVFQRLSTDDVTVRLYVLRAISCLLGMATLWCVWSGTRLLLGERAAAVVAIWAALHPQFAVVSVTASPDSVVNLAGAVIWWQIGRVWTGAPLLGALAALLLAALAATAVARLGLPVAVIALGACVWGFAHRWTRTAGPRPLMLTAAAILIAASGVAWWFGETMSRIVWYGTAPLRVALSSAEFAHPHDWFDTLHASFWLTAGWMRFPAAEPVLWVVAGVAACAAAGLVKACTQDRSIRPLVLVAAVCVAVQYAAVFAAFYLNGIGAQGRYLIPVLGAVLSLTFVGLTGLVPAHRQGLASTAFVAGACVLNLVSWRSVLPHFGT